MKKRLMVCAMAASAALFAGVDVTSGNVYGIMRVSDTSSSNTVVAVPWVAVAGEGNVTLSNLVSTANLSEGDKLYLYDPSGTWFVYTRNASGVWEGATTLSGDAVNPAVPADSKTLDRGTGLIIQRGSTATPIYLCGRYVESVPSATSISANATTLIANPTTRIVYITTTVGTVGDKISIPKNGGAMEEYTRKADGWYGWVTTTLGGKTSRKLTKLTDGVSIAPGRGAFYICGDSGTSISWQQQ